MTPIKVTNHLQVCFIGATEALGETTVTCYNDVKSCIGENRKERASCTTLVSAPKDLVQKGILQEEWGQMESQS